MGDVVNLRSVRKAKARASREVEAQANRAKFGRTKGDKLREAQDAERAAKLLDGAKREEP
ncbi:DUF4169 domain-containing protein [Novosphingobium sp. THN1]|jgi:hypothetical protein|uniref:DUF4169 family protein n=1 Tax=unclassified Novosphingobium TaxID=2644732 RepID=UPI000E4D953D|nr:MULTISPECIES: DUF4169 family protein [unclassified Novosphingobium]AXU19388.1 DUF4169 domain-containing protein [Novosphingobium sp. THN1]NLR39129.1 DUF4169 family protein [Novosphingobium sp. ERW19]